jgi:hypothetical protein
MMKMKYAMAKRTIGSWQTTALLIRQIPFITYPMALLGIWDVSQILQTDGTGETALIKHDLESSAQSQAS